MTQSGQQILHYRLTEKLGEGGMGVVWKATDSTLGREVALKALPPAFSTDPERLARFEREARLLASLNHPNIATVYSVHVVEGERYLAMEMVPGEDLAHRIERGPLPVPEAIAIAHQIALALEAAHESGVVHRDLKPANVRLTPDGRVKVLDFGLAKALEGASPASGLSQSPTIAGTAMTPGMIVGTAAYMSPEQARGRAVDRRADIWAFGVVLYEMLTGQRAFDGETVSDILAGVLRAEPDRARLPAETPRRLRALIDRCLEKDPRRRLRDIGEALLILEDEREGKPDVAAPAAAAATPARAGRSRERLFWLAGLAAVALIAALAGRALEPGPPEAPLRKFTLALKSESGQVNTPVISPDGRQIAYIHERKLWVRDLAQLTSRALAEDLDEDFRPLWSPDGEFIVFGDRAGLSRVSVASAAIAPICAAGDLTGGSGGTWTADGHLLFTKGQDHIYRVAAGGGVPAVFFAKRDSVDADLHHPFALPGDRGVLCVRHLIQGGPNTIALARGSELRDLLALPAGLIWHLVYDPRGFIIFSRIGEGAGLWALPFSLERQQVTGEAFLIAPEGGSPSIAAGGELVYRLGTIGVESQVVRVDRAGTVIESLTEPRLGNWSMALSPDERLLALETREGGEGDLWLYDLERKAQTRFAFGPGRQGEPSWSPDSRELAWGEFTLDNIAAKPADGSRAPRRLVRGYLGQYTADGAHMVYVRNGQGSGPDIWYGSITAPDSMPLVATDASEMHPMPSPRADYLLYVSDESGRQEVYLKPFPSGEGRWQVSTEGGSRARWSARGDRIYYWTTDEVYEVAVELSPAVRLGNPRVLLNLGDLRMQNWGRYNFLPTADPDRFLALKVTSTSNESHVDVIVVQNWLAEFRKPRP
jgi:Tol biopolymer transport system component